MRFRGQTTLHIAWSQQDATTRGVLCEWSKWLAWHGCIEFQFHTDMFENAINLNTQHQPLETRIHAVAGPRMILRDNRFDIWRLWRDRRPHVSCMSDLMVFLLQWSGNDRQISPWNEISRDIKVLRLRSNPVWVRQRDKTLLQAAVKVQTYSLLHLWIHTSSVSCALLYSYPIQSKLVAHLLNPSPARMSWTLKIGN